LEVDLFSDKFPRLRFKRQIYYCESNEGHNYALRSEKKNIFLSYAVCIMLRSDLGTFVAVMFLSAGPSGRAV